jgi:hypothetical protein
VRELPLAEDRFLGTSQGPAPSAPAARPPEPPRAPVDPEPPAPDDPRDFELEPAEVAETR